MHVACPGKVAEPQRDPCLVHVMFILYVHDKLLATEILEIAFKRTEYRKLKKNYNLLRCNYINR